MPRIHNSLACNPGRTSIFPMTSKPEILCESSSSGIGYIWLNRESKANAMGSEFFSLFPRLVEKMENDNRVRVIILGSTSRNFSTGIDLDVLNQLTAVQSSAGVEFINSKIKEFQAALSVLAQCEKPVIAAINGFCVGGGLDLASCADIRLCSRDAVFSIRETRLGMIPDLGSIQRLARVLSRGQLSEIALTGEDFSATKALEIGLVNYLLEDKTKLMEEANLLASRIAENAPSAIAGIKGTIANTLDIRLNEELDFVAKLNTRQLLSDEFRRYHKDYISQIQNKRDSIQ